MFCRNKRLQYPSKVETSDPVFACMLQQATGGAAGEVRLCIQHLFLSWDSRGLDPKSHDMLMRTATEEIGHIEMPATAVALNLEGASTELLEQGVGDGIVSAVMGSGSARYAIEGVTAVC